MELSSDFTTHTHVKCLSRMHSSCEQLTQSLITAIDHAQYILQTSEGNECARRLLMQTSAYVIHFCLKQDAKLHVDNILKALNTSKKDSLNHRSVCSLLNCLDVSMDTCKFLHVEITVNIFR
jgi:hypothetical protein